MNALVLARGVLAGREVDCKLRLGAHEMGWTELLRGAFADWAVYFGG